MALPTYVIEIQFGSSSYVDVSSYVENLTIGRGISRSLDDYSAGSISITFVNNARVFDPLNTSSILYYSTGGYTMVQPGGKLRVSANGIRIFTGFITTWDFTYDQAGLDGKATVTALDEIYRVSNATFAETTNNRVETASERIAYVLNFQGFSAPEYSGVQAGRTLLGGDTNSAGDNVLSYLQNVARSEPADFFSNASAVMVMKDKSFTDYSWTNTIRQNFIKYPGPNTRNTATGTGLPNGWTYGTSLSTAVAPIFGGTSNFSTAIAIAGDTEMSYAEVAQTKYNPYLSGSGTYVFSSWHYAQSGALTLTGNYAVVDGNNQTLASTAVSTGITNGSWTQITATLPWSGIAAGISVFMSVPGTVGTLFYGNGWLAESGTSYTNYFDGSWMPVSGSSTARYEVAWMGTPYQSSSGMLQSTASTATASTILTFADQNSQGASFGNGTGIPFTDLAVTYGSEQMYNSIQVVGVNATATASDTALISRYGLRSYTQADNLTTSLTRPTTIASNYLAENRLPEYRAQAITLALESLTSAQQNLVLAVELRNVIRVCFQPSATGSVVSKYYQVLGIDNNSDPERTHITFRLSSLDRLGIRLDSTLLSILDTSILG